MNGKAGTTRLFARSLGRAAVSVLGCICLVQAPARAADNPKDRPYPHGSWTEDCSYCHREDRWLPAVVSPKWQHPKSFPLRGAHATAACRSCHQSLEFSKVGRSCVECHQDVHRGEFGLDCARCHTTRNFLDRAEAARNHRATRFPLTGAHAVADCEACHRMVSEGKSMYLGLPTDCAACHNSSGFPGAEQRPPDHAQNNFPLDCVQCHTTISFGNAKFDHSLTGFPLTGAHRALSCAQCHGNPFNRNLDPSCYACHKRDYDGTTDPNHAQAGFPTDCLLCHNTTSWGSGTFDHASTGFPLTGAHIGLQCAQCHGNPFNRNLSPQCVACHQKDYDGTTDPNHRAAGFPTDCTLCHTTASWAGATFNHQNTQFPLTGAHATLPCSACHADGVYKGKPTDCYSCHQKDYTGTTDPNHVAANFDHNCALCHTTVDWTGAKYTQHDSLYFPIYSGTHNGRWSKCSDCHTTSGNYAAFSCFLCHPKADTDAHHTGVPGYSYDSNACYRCHPQGRAG